MKIKQSTRATQRSYRLGRSTLYVTLRRFRTKTQNHSTKYRQHIVKVHIGSVKEISFHFKRRKPVMRPKTLRRQSWQPRAIAPIIIIFIGGAGVGAFSTELVLRRSIEPLHTFTTTAIQQAASAAKPLTMPASQPTHLNIPAQKIDVDITPVGLASDGTIEMPPVLDWITGWYKYSPKPGQLGPAIIVGHVDSYKGISVFWNLRYLQAGDKIYVSRADGTTAVFAVTALKQFAQADFPTQQVYGNIGYAGLRLITCGGTFSTATGSYDQNTVVYAQLVSKS